MFKQLCVVGIAVVTFCGPGFGQDKYVDGIVYGPKAAFNVKAPEGRVLDIYRAPSLTSSCPRGINRVTTKTLPQLKEILKSFA
jgi:hypothetical protein